MKVERVELRVQILVAPITVCGFYKTSVKFTSRRVVWFLFRIALVLDLVVTFASVVCLCRALYRPAIVRCRRLLIDCST
mgnify:CR=1 FL=1